jgi:hypothetical protein
MLTNYLLVVYKVKKATKISNSILPKTITKIREFALIATMMTVIIRTL